MFPRLSRLRSPLKPWLRSSPTFRLIPSAPPTTSRPPRRNRMFESAAASASGDTEKEPMPTMGFLDHLEELRKRIVYSIAAVAVGFGVCWGYHERIYAVMQKPIMETLKGKGLSEKLV